MQQTQPLTTAGALMKELESRYLTPADLLTFDRNPTKWPKRIGNFKSRVHNKFFFTNSMQMGGLISVLKGGNKRAVEEIDRNSNFYPPALKLLQREFGNQLFIRHLKKKNFSSNHQ